VSAPSTKTLSSASWPISACRGTKITGSARDAGVKDLYGPLKHAEHANKARPGAPLLLAMP